MAALTARSIAAPGCTNKRSGGVDPHHFAVALELPGRRRAWEARAGRRGRADREGAPAAACIEITGRRGRGEALDARTDRDRDHVLLEPLFVADPGIAARGQHIDETALDDDLQPDVRIGLQERRDDRWQHQTGGARGHVELERSGRPVAKDIHDVDSRLDLAESRCQPL